MPARPYAAMVLGALLGALLASQAHADVTAPPLSLGAMNRASSTIATGGTSQQALAANPGRKVFCVEDPSAATEDLFLDFGQPASTTSGVSIDIPPGSLFCMGGGAIYTGQITVNAVTTSHAFIVYEGQ